MVIPRHASAPRPLPFDLEARRGRSLRRRCWIRYWLRVAGIAWLLTVVIRWLF